MQPAELIEIWRGGRCESQHLGHVVICDSKGVVEAWGNPDEIIYPRSSCKMVQALPLIESGAADAAGLTEAQLALACASHNGARMHYDAVADWLKTRDLSENDLRCGCHMPRDAEESRRLICADASPDQMHNNCSGKHAGFLTLNQHLQGNPEYTEIDHPVQQAIKDAFEDVTGAASPGYGIDGCSAPNYTCRLSGLAHAMAQFARPKSDRRGQAMQRLVDSMRKYPELVSGEGRACANLIRASQGKVAVKTGAEGVFVAILPEQGLGVALKIADGATRASEAAIAAVLVHLGVIEQNDPVSRKYLNAPIRNWNGIETGEIRPANGFPI